MPVNPRYHRRSHVLEIGTGQVDVVEIDFDQPGSVEAGVGQVGPIFEAHGFARTPDLLILDAQLPASTALMLPSDRSVDRGHRFPPDRSAFSRLFEDRLAQVSAAALIAPKVASIPLLAASRRIPISFGASSPKAFSKKAAPSGGSSHVSVSSVPPSTPENV